jgi:hypothetical protein
VNYDIAICSEAHTVAKNLIVWWLSQDRFLGVYIHTAFRNFGNEFDHPF